MLDYEYIKNYCSLTTVGLSKQKELNADPKAIQQIELIGQLKNDDGVNADGTQSMFVVTILERIKKTRFECSQGSVTVF